MCCNNVLCTLDRGWIGIGLGVGVGWEVTKFVVMLHLTFVRLGISMTYVLGQFGPMINPIWGPLRDRVEISSAAPQFVR